jgi:signal transduction histidine kinase
MAKSLVNHIMELGMAREGVFRNMSCTISGLAISVLRDFFDLTDASMAEKINLCEGLSHLKALLGEKGILISVEQGPWCQEIRLDEVKVKQIFRNLLINAMKYRNNTVEIKFDFEGRFLKLSVRDDGKGIDVMYHEKIFESYFQVDDIDKYGVRSHGLGLAGALVLIEDMGGELLLESDKGKGTKFIAKIPIRED